MSPIRFITVFLKTRCNEASRSPSSTANADLFGRLLNISDATVQFPQMSSGLLHREIMEADEVASQVLPCAVRLSTERTCGEALVALQVSQQRLPVSVETTADVAVVPTCRGHQSYMGAQKGGGRGAYASLDFARPSSPATFLQRSTHFMLCGVTPKIPHKPPSLTVRPITRRKHCLWLSCSGTE